MLRFKVFDESGPAATWPLVHAHLVGADDFSVPGEVAFKSGSIVCKPASRGSAVALCLEVDAGKAGTMMLQTCRLRQRDEPYRLYEELARHRLKVYLEKSEMWGLLDPDRAPEASPACWSGTPFVRRCATGSRSPSGRSPPRSW
jgi:hypothetical protein